MPALFSFSLFRLLARIASTDPATGYAHGNAMPQQRYRTRGTPLDDKPAHASRKNLLFAAAVEALGLIGTPEAGEALLAEVVRLPAFPIYDRRAAWIGNQTSPVHFRFLQAFDATRLSTNISSPHVHRMVLAGIVS